MRRRVGRMGPIKRGWPRQHNSAGARAPGVKRRLAACTVVYQRTAFPDFEPGHNDKVARCTKDGCKPCDAYITQSTGRHRLTYRPWSRTEENSPSGILGGAMETAASSEARFAPSSYPTPSPPPPKGMPFTSGGTGPRGSTGGVTERWRAVLRPHSTGQGGEAQGFRKERPRDPLEGRGKQATHLLKET
jgi:hypothetical protein